MFEGMARTGRAALAVAFSLSPLAFAGCLGSCPTINYWTATWTESGFYQHFPNADVGGYHVSIDGIGIKHAVKEMGERQVSVSANSHDGAQYIVSVGKEWTVHSRVLSDGDLQDLFRGSMRDLRIDHAGATPSFSGSKNCG